MGPCTCFLEGEEALWQVEVWAGAEAEADVRAVVEVRAEAEVRARVKVRSQQTLCEWSPGIHHSRRSF
jgi:hypothetical protein